MLWAKYLCQIRGTLNNPEGCSVVDGIGAERRGRTGEKLWTYRVHFVSNDEFYSESDARRWASGAATMFEGTVVAVGEAGTLFADVSVPVEQTDAFKALMDEDSLVTSYKSQGFASA